VRYTAERAAAVPVGASSVAYADQPNGDNLATVLGDAMRSANKHCGVAKIRSISESLLQNHGASITAEVFFSAPRPSSIMRSGDAMAATDHMVEVATRAVVQYHEAALANRNLRAAGEAAQSIAGHLHKDALAKAKSVCRFEQRLAALKAVPRRYHRTRRHRGQRVRTGPGTDRQSHQYPRASVDDTNERGSP
jgi:hypothetical protein